MTQNLRSYELPLPSPNVYDPGRVGEFYTPDYNVIMAAATEFRKKHNVQPRRKDNTANLVGLTVIDQQVTFCLTSGELTLAPASIGDTQRICEFMYRNNRIISDLIVTLDTHYLFHIFHPLFWLDANGDNVGGFTVILPDDVGKKYFVNPEMCGILFRDKPEPMKGLSWLQNYAIEYTRKLMAEGKPPLVVWPVHGRLGHPGHALVPAFAAAVDFHDVLRYSATQYRIKGDLPLSEYYSPFGTEIVDVTIGGKKVNVGEVSDRAIGDLLKYKVLIIAGEARSHCVRAGILDILNKIKAQDPKLAQRVYILEDCTSNVPTFEKQGDDAIEEFKANGMNVVKSTTAMADWPNIPREIFPSL